MATKDVHALILGTCEYGMLHGKRDSAYAIKFMAEVGIRGKRSQRDLKYARTQRVIAGGRHMESMRRNEGRF